jgi:hypothetical protein
LNKVLADLVFKGVKMKVLILLSCLLFNFNVFSYSVFTLKPVNWSHVKTVDVFIAGFGHEMGLQFLSAAITRAKIHEERYPESRAQLILWAEEWNKSRDGAVLRSRGMTILHVNSRKLKNKDIFDYLDQLTSISSLHIISHSAAFAGNAIQKSTSRLGLENFPWKKLRSKFTKDSYVYLHGCNTGFIVAPAISKVLERPVFGSLTSTDFQEIFANGNWYHNNAGVGQFPSGMGRLKNSGELYNESLSCQKGFCHRMMPNRHPYRGYWGRYEVGLPYYRPFCNYGSNVSQACRAGIAHAIFTTPTILSRSWEDTVLDHMCPRMADPSVFDNCAAVLKGQAGNRVFIGKYLGCSLKGCNFQLARGRNRNGNVITNFVGRDEGIQQMRKDFNFFMSLR